MIWGLQSRDTTPFISLEPMRAEGRDCELYEKGHEVGVLVNEAKRSMLAARNSSNYRDLIELLRRCSDLDQDLQLWYRQIREQSNEPLYQPSPSEQEQSITTPTEQGEEDTLVFSSLPLALALLLFWTLQLKLSSTIIQIYSDILATDQQLNPASQESTLANTQPLRGSTTISNELYDFIHRMRKTHNNSTCLELANRIFSAVPYCSDANGKSLCSIQRSVYALQAALSVFRAQNSEKLVRCERLYQDLTAKDGAKMGKVVGVWTEEEEAELRKADEMAL